MIRAALVAGFLSMGQAAVAQSLPAFDASARFEVQQVLGRDTALVAQGQTQFKCIWDDSTATTAGAFVEVRGCVPIVAKAEPVIADVTDPFLAKSLIVAASDEMMSDGFVAAMKAVNCVLDMNRYEANREAFAGPILKTLGIDERLAGDVVDDVDRRLEGILAALGDDVELDRSAGELRLVRGCN